MSFPVKVKEHSILASVVSKSERKPKVPDEQISVEHEIAMVKELVTENVEGGHILKKLEGLVSLFFLLK